MTTPHVRELTDLPRANYVSAGGSVYSVPGTAFLVYESGEEEHRDGFAVVRLDRWRVIDRDAPNEEALHNLPWRPFGLQTNALQEVVDSPWIVDRARIRHMDGIVSPGFVRDQRHFVFAFKDNGVECIAAGYELVGVYPAKEVLRIVGDLLAAEMRRWQAP